MFEYAIMVLEDELKVIKDLIDKIGHEHDTKARQGENTDKEWIRLKILALKEHELEEALKVLRED